ncbi:hypothetical protein EMIT051CA3_110004 [Pseudomonas chlororaphis]
MRRENNIQVCLFVFFKRLNFYADGLRVLCLLAGAMVLVQVYVAS